MKRIYESPFSYMINKGCSNKSPFQKLFKAFDFPIETHVLSHHINFQVNPIIFWSPESSPKIYKSLTKLNFFSFQNTLCGYSKVASGDAWTAQKGINSIRSPSTEKTSKTCSILGIFKMMAHRPHFGCFLRTGWSDWINSFLSCLYVSWRKFRVPTKGVLEREKNQVC